MNNDLFVVTGGGTGAKVAEALVHLCAAGVGPRRLHILLVDSDTANGNLNRALHSAAVYDQLQSFSWNVKADVKYGFLKGGDQVSLGLFGTEIRVHQLTKPIDSVLNGGLETAIDSPAMGMLLNLLYDKEEQRATCDDGFRARPNLGCLLLADHLNQQLEESAPGFFDALRAALGQGSGQTVPIVVAASVFGGTGASLLPIARRAIERVLRRSMDKSVLDGLSWGAVKLLPHYQPTKKRESVDPQRFLLDSAGALQYYSTVYDSSAKDGRYDTAYVIGSDNPSRNKVQPVLGHSAQANPGYVEEFVAALAALDFAMQPVKDGLPTRVFAPAEVSWSMLPNSPTLELSSRFAYLLHLGSFFLRQGLPSSSQQQTQGLLQLLKSIDGSTLQTYPWYGEILDAWAKNFSSYNGSAATSKVDVLKNQAQLGKNSIDHMSKPAAEYFGRLLLWAESALASADCPLMEYSAADYAVLYSTMSDVDAPEIEVGGGKTYQPEADNGLVRIGRAALVGMIHSHKKAARKKKLGTDFQLLNAANRIEVRTSSDQVVKSLQGHSLGRVVDEYTKTIVTS